MKEIFFDLIKQSEKVFHGMMKDLLKKYNINLTDYYTLSSIYDGHNTVSSISKYEHIIKSSVSMCCKCLALKGYIKSVRDIENKRIIILTLTKKSIDLIEEGRLIEEDYQNVLFNGIDKEQLDISKNVFNILKNNLNEMEEER